MNVESLSGLVNRVIAWADRLQRQHGALGFPYAFHLAAPGSPPVPGGSSPAGDGPG